MNSEEVKSQARQIFWKSLKAPFVMFWAIRIRKAVIWDAEPSLYQRMQGATVIGEPVPVHWGRLPEKYSDYETPDEKLPGGLYEPTVFKKFTEDGPEKCAFYWLGIRNRAHGFAMRFAKPASRYWTDAEGLQEQGEGEDRIWLERKFYLGKRFERLRGYRVYSKDGGKSFYATPVWTIKRA